MKHIIDTDNWKRRNNFDFFRRFLNPWYSVTTEIDCTVARTTAKNAGRSFFIYYLYAVTRAVNEVDEFRYRTDSQGNVAFYDSVDVVCPVAVPGDAFYSVRIPYFEDFERFYTNAKNIISDIPENGDPYDIEKTVIEKGDYDVFLLSAVPNLYFTSVTYAQEAPGNPTQYPLMTVGKAVLREGRYIMPFSLFVNHAFVDGGHIAGLVEKIQKYMNTAVSQT